jgi:tetratricopeptide (TPR) repeat protein
VREPRRAVPALLILTLAAYSDALLNPFVFDDRTLIENPSIRDLTAWRWIIGGSRRVVTHFTYALDYAVFGLHVWGWHATDFILHAANVCLIYFFVRRLGRDDEQAAPLSVVTAALFAVHPLLTESVGYVSSRAGLLATLFMLLGLRAWQSMVAGRKWVGLIVCLCWALAVLSKETGLLFPGVLFFYDSLFAPDRAAARRRILRLHLPLGFAAVALGATRLIAYLRLEGGQARPMGTTLLTQAAALWHYAGLFIAPVGLTVEHDFRLASSPYDPWAWAQVLLLGSLGVIIARWRRSAASAFGAAWFLLLLTPALAAPLTQTFAEHRAYEACVGAALVVGMALSRWRMLPAVVVLTLAMATAARNRDWRSPVALWQDAVEKAESSWMAHDELGDAYREAGRCRDAVPEYRRAAQLLPAGARAWMNLGICLAELGDLDGAEGALTQVLSRSPSDPRAHLNLALVARSRGRPEVAVDHLQRALAVDRRYLKARRLLIEIFARELPHADAVSEQCKLLEQLAPGEPPPGECNLVKARN